MMFLRKLANHYPSIMRLSLFFVLIYFGIYEILNPLYFSGYVPPFIAGLSIYEPNLFIKIHGLILMLLSLSIIFRFYLRFAGILTILMLMQIIGGLLLIYGFNEIVTRDIGILGLAVSVWLYEVKNQEKK